METTDEKIDRLIASATNLVSLVPKERVRLRQLFVSVGLFGRKLIERSDKLMNEKEPDSFFIPTPEVWGRPVSNTDMRPPADFTVAGSVIIVASPSKALNSFDGEEWKSV